MKKMLFVVVLLSILIVGCSAKIVSLKGKIVRIDDSGNSIINSAKTVIPICYPDYKLLQEGDEVILTKKEGFLEVTCYHIEHLEY